MGTPIYSLVEENLILNVKKCYYFFEKGDNNAKNED